MSTIEEYKTELEHLRDSIAKLKGDYQTRITYLEWRVKQSYEKVEASDRIEVLKTIVEDLEEL